ncbi:MAG: mevalonate kinase [Caldilinea sp.]
MDAVVTSSPGKVILFGEHGVNRQQPALSIAVDLRLYCRVEVCGEGYELHLGERHEAGSLAALAAFKARVDAMRNVGDLDEIRTLAHDFFAAPRYVLAHVLERSKLPGVVVTWRSGLPIGSGMGSGAAASTAMILGIMRLAGRPILPEDLAWLAWQGDVIAHGGVASSLDSSTCAYGGLLRFTVADGPQPLSLRSPLPLVIGDSRVQKSTAEANTRVRRWLDAHPAHTQLFRDMGYLVGLAQEALACGNLTALGHLMNLHQLMQEKLSTGWPQGERLIEAAIGAGALGAKISGSGLGGIIIALAPPGQEQNIAAAIDHAGGRSYVAPAGAEGTRVEPEYLWEAQKSFDMSPLSQSGGEKTDMKGKL